MLDRLTVNVSSGLQRDYFPPLSSDHISKLILKFAPDDMKKDNLNRLLVSYNHKSALKMVRYDIASFIDKEKLVPGVAVAFGGNDQADTIFVGRQGDNTGSRNIDADTIFDLASLSKLFTCLLVLKLSEEGEIHLYDPVRIYDPRLKAVSDYTIADLLEFKPELMTAERIDNAKTAAEALCMITDDLRIKKLSCRPYNDLQSICLGLILQQATGQDLFALLRQMILEPFGMTDTRIRIPDTEVYRLAAVEKSYFLNANEQLIEETVLPGQVHDPKARVLGMQGQLFCGHAGLFATTRDIIAFCQSLLNEKLLPLDIIRQIGINRTGKKMENGRWRQFLGYQCYTRHPVQELSEVSQLMSGLSFACSGYTGMHLSIDPINLRFIFIGSNRLHHRIGRIDPAISADSYKIIEDKTGLIVSQDFVYRKDHFIRDPVAFLLTMDLLRSHY